MKRVFFSSLLALLIIGGIAFGYFYYEKYRQPKGDAFSLIPKDAGFVFETKNIFKAMEGLKNSGPWLALCAGGIFPDAGKGLAYLDSVAAKNEILRNFLTSNSVYISSHLTNANGFDFLFLFPLPGTGQEKITGEIIGGLFGEDFESAKRNYDGTTIREINVGEQTFAFTITGGVLAGSFAPILVEDLIRQSKSSAARTVNSYFTSVRESAGKKVDGNLYVNYENLSKTLSVLLSEGNGEIAKSLIHLAQWSGFDLKLKNSALALSGFSSFRDSSDYLSIFSGQAPQKTSLLEIIPRRTAMFLYTSFSNLNSFREKQKLVLKNSGKPGQDFAAEILKNYGINPEEKLTSWLGNEYALVVTEPGGSRTENTSFGVFRCRDISLAGVSLKELSLAANSKQPDSSEAVVSEKYNGRTIEFINIPGLLPAVFGNDFENMGRVFYTFINEYVIFANQVSALRTFTDDFEAKKILAREPSWQSVSENISSSANRFVYVNLQRFIQVISPVCDTSAIHLTRVREGISAFTFQASGGGNLLYTHTMFHKSDSLQADAMEVWATALDTSISMAPAIVTNPKTGEKEILVQDDNGMLYLINAEGEILFRKQLSEKIISDIFQIDFYKNDKWQFMFSTETFAYVIDRKGEKVKNYPVRLPFAASAGIQVLDYENTKEYRWFVPCINNRLYAFQLSGKPLDGWKFNESASYMEFPVQYVKLADKEFLVISDTTGAVFILDRKGKKRIEISEKINARFISPLKVLQGKTIAESCLVSSDPTGKIISIYFDGRVHIGTFPDTEATRYFDFMDVNADNSVDFVFLDSTNLRVNGRDSSVIFTHTFNSSISNKPLCFRFSNSKGKIGVVSSATNELFLFNDDGTLYHGFPLKGSTGFAIGDFSGDGRMNIVAGSSDKNVYLYSLE